MWYNIFVMPIFHAETLWDNTELRKAKSFIQMQGMDIGGNNGIPYCHCLLLVILFVFSYLNH